MIDCDFDSKSNLLNFAATNLYHNRQNISAPEITSPPFTPQGNDLTLTCTFTIYNMQIRPKAYWVAGDKNITGRSLLLAFLQNVMESFFHSFFRARNLDKHL